jgi:protein-S-isoprenylcysteine O-methyltransferase Ste14
MTTTLNRGLALFAAYTEKYVLSLVFFCLALPEFKQIWSFLSGQLGAETTVFVKAGNHLIMLLLYLFTGLLLPLACRPAVPPQKLRFVLVPLAATFFYLAYSTVPWFPASLQINLCPQSLQMSLLAAGLTCAVVGPLFGLWGILHLGRSFGIYVTVRKVVTTGPYKWVRHPMYLGACCMCVGVAIANFSVAYFLLVAMHISLLLYRAHLEQTQLSEHSAEYREYMKRTRFIFPKFRQSAGESPKAE